MIPIHEEQWALGPTESLPQTKRDLHAVAAMQMNFVQTANKSAMLLARVFNMTRVWREIDRMNRSNDAASLTKSLDGDGITHLAKNFDSFAEHGSLSHQKT